MMQEQSPSARFQHFLATRPLSKFFAMFLHHVDKLVFRLTGGRTCALALLLRLPVVNLTTVGAKSGRLRTIPLLGIPDETQSGRFAVIASNFGQSHAPGWYYNLKAQPLVTCMVHGKSQQYSACEVFEQEYDRFWNRAASIFAGYYNYKARAQRHIPIIVLTPYVAGTTSAQ